MKVLITKQLPYLEETAQELAVHADVVWASSLEPRSLVAAAEGVQVLIATKGARVDRALLDALPKLELVAVPTAGYDWVDVEACSATGVPVFANTGVAPEPVADFTVALMLLQTRRIIFADRAMRVSRDFAEVRNRFATATRDAGEELQELPIGLIGLGAIGKCVAGRLQALGCSRLFGYDPYAASTDDIWRVVARVDSARALAERVRVLSVHVPLMSDTVGLIGAGVLGAMPPGSFLINTSRGGVVDEPALVDALQAGRLAGAALDVFADEPLPADSPLWTVDTLVITPHIAGVTRESDGRRARNTARQILRAVAGERPDGLVNPEIWEHRRQRV